MRVFRYCKYLISYQCQKINNAYAVINNYYKFIEVEKNKLIKERSITKNNYKSKPNNLLILFFSEVRGIIHFFKII
jgi:ABC-type uncharacterized transport system substrate-binding protein